MEVFRRKTHIDFIGWRRPAIAVSMALNVLTLIALFVSGLNFGLDFTGGTLVELAYEQPADVEQVRRTLTEGGFRDAVVQRYGTTKELMVRLPVHAEGQSAAVSARLVAALRESLGEREVESRPGQAQRCVPAGGGEPRACALQVKRIEFVGPQVGRELAEKGALALILTALGILVYVIFRFEWRFAVGAIAASAHDVLLLFGFYAVTQIEFSLTSLAAILTVLGYSLNDTIVIFDRVRENFRKMRKHAVIEIMNTSLNETLSRTIITGGTTLLTMLALYLYGGDVLSGFALAMIFGVLVGTYSSLFIATPVTLALGITREDMLPPKKEAAADAQP
ncbi:preprotein translocase subunit SecF [Sulfurifustis variabilis]|uniref:Protein-export membrane protein SecF n=1 Tax=Sulfurifustis variabilis TaxID=1675686 RepID=A0A1B4V543_9GAMM|nr:protein translocase subunit SecF [Sulfurifustis variabilis]BAU48663.1 preprotein translocase subunit SecF [Sulfurifustis variabilis]